MIGLCFALWAVCVKVNILNNDIFLTLLYLHTVCSVCSIYLPMFVTLYGFMALNHALASCWLMSVCLTSYCIWLQSMRRPSFYLWLFVIVKHSSFVFEQTCFDQSPSSFFSVSVLAAMQQAMTVTPAPPWCTAAVHSTAYTHMESSGAYRYMLRPYSLSAHTVVTVYV